MTAYCQQFGIGSRVASFLVLENEADYKRLNLEEERGKTVSGDLGAFSTTLWTQLGKAMSAGKAFDALPDRRSSRVSSCSSGDNGEHVKQLLALLARQGFRAAAQRS